MKKLLLIVAGTILAAVAVFFIARPGDDLDGLGGPPWAIVSVEIEGKKMSLKQLPHRGVKFTKEAAIWIMGNGEGEPARLSIDPSKTPKEIDIALSEDTPVAPGIYQINGDVLTICLGDRRPKDFSSKDKQMLWTFKRS